MTQQVTHTKDSMCEGCTKHTANVQVHTLSNGSGLQCAGWPLVPCSAGGTTCADGDLQSDFVFAALQAVRC